MKLNQQCIMLVFEVMFHFLECSTIFQQGFLILEISLIHCLSSNLDKQKDLKVKSECTLILPN